MKFIGGWACLMLAAASALPATVDPVVAQASPDPSMTPSPILGGAAWAALLGNTITGITADGVYFEFFAPDGTVIHVDGDGREAGSWSLSEKGVCFSYPADPDEHAECRRVEVQGTRGGFIDPDGSRYPFDILPGNAKHL